MYYIRCMRNGSSRSNVKPKPNFRLLQSQIRQNRINLKLSNLVDLDVASQSIFFLNSILLLYLLHRLYASILHLSCQFSKAFTQDALKHYWFLTMWNAQSTNCHVQHTSRAYHRCIFSVTAVMDTPSVVPTIEYRTFTSSARNIIQPNLTSSGAESGIPWGTYRTRISQLATNDSCVRYIPEVITNSSPYVIVIYFNSSFPASKSSN